MKIVLNGAPRSVSSASLIQLLEELDLASAKVATAVNEEFVPVGARENCTLQEGDRVEIVAPMQGG